MLEKLKENKAVKVIYNICYWLLAIFIIMVLAVVVIQRFSNNEISLGGFRIFNVVSESMIPKYEIGDVLLAKEEEISNLKIGDDVVYEGEKGNFAGRIVTHQIIDIEKKDGEEDIFHTKGLANEEEDPVISGDQILGVVVYHIKSISFISKLTTNVYSFYFVIFIPIVILVGLEIRKFVINKYAEDEEEYDDEEYEEDEIEDENRK